MTDTRSTDWTTSPPTAPGYYWFRDPEAGRSRTEDRGAIIVLVSLLDEWDGAHLQFSSAEPGLYHSESVSDWPRAEWAGPLTPPSDDNHI